MRLARLAAPAFGPFTDFALELSDAGTDLHLIFGPNEAGKSSLLRAIGDLLYGIPARTADGFLHEYPDLRIAATLIGRNGNALSIQRRKGNKNTLLDAAGASLPDDALDGLLGVVDRDFFTTVFALDSDALRGGAEALLQGKGDIGEALFSASLAGTPVHQVRAALEADAAALFDGRKTKGVSIRPLLGDHEQGLKASREATVRPEEWTRALDAVAEAGAERDRLDETIRQRDTRRDWVQRCLDALPVIGALDEQEQQRAELPPLPDLSADFVDATEQALGARERARNRVADLEQATSRLQGRVENNTPDLGILDRAGEIESLHATLAVQREWRNERAALKTEQARLAEELAAGVRDLGIDGPPEAAESLRAEAEAVLSLQASAKTLEDRMTEADAQREHLEERRQELRRVDDDLAALTISDPTALRGALTRTEAAAQSADRLPELEQALAAAARDCAARHQLLPGSPSDYAAACALPVPTASLLRQCAEEDRRIAADLARAEADADAADTAGRRLAAELDRLQRRGTLPTEQDLTEARSHRDRTWDQVLAAWRHGEPVEPAADDALAETYPRTVRAADKLVDQLRADADAVARAQNLRDQQQAAAEEAARAREAQADAESARADWQGRWQAIWTPCGISPGDPEQMQEWREHWLALREAFGAWQSADAALTQSRDRIDQALSLLRPLLPDAPADDLPSLREAAMRRVSAADQASGARKQLQQRQRALRNDLEAQQSTLPALEQQEAAAHGRWRADCRALGLPEEATAETVLALMERRNALVARYDHWQAQGRSLAERERQIADYEARVQALAEALALPVGSADAREGLLWQALAEARARKTRHDQASRDLVDEQERLLAAKADLEQAERDVQDRLTRAAVVDERALAPLLDQLRREQALAVEIERRRQSLHPIARGEPLDAFIERVRGEDADGLAAERTGLDQAIEELRRERDQALRAWHDASAEKTRLERAGEDAAAHLQAAKNAAAHIRRDAGRYLRLKLAAHLLRELIERYRRESQGPLLARAGALFRRATANSFDGLGTAYADDDKPVLVGLRGDAEVHVEGMSDGTRDQLYLALRIAAIERHLDQHEPMPMVLDDLLMTFDDHRCLAILPMLGELAGKTQILLFTHHRHLLDLAREALGDDGFHRHELG
jgi:uncharacterized protein YhaN